MGCGASTNAVKVLSPQTNRDVLIETRLAPLLNPTHDLNVNRKYTYLYTVIPNEFVNKGVHKTNKYIALVTQKELDDKRTEFWGKLNRIASRRQ